MSQWHTKDWGDIERVSGWHEGLLPELRERRPVVLVVVLAVTQGPGGRQPADEMDSCRSLLDRKNRGQISTKSLYGRVGPRVQATVVRYCCHLQSGRAGVPPFQAHGGRGRPWHRSSPGPVIFEDGVWPALLRMVRSRTNSKAERPSVGVQHLSLWG